MGGNWVTLPPFWGTGGGVSTGGGGSVGGNWLTAAGVWSGGAGMIAELLSAILGHHTGAPI